LQLRNALLIENPMEFPEQEIEEFLHGVDHWQRVRRIKAHGRSSLRLFSKRRRTLLNLIYCIALQIPLRAVMASFCMLNAKSER